MTTPGTASSPPSPHEAPPAPSARRSCARLAEYGCPEQMLTDNGRQFTGRFTRPRPSEVLFERILRRNGIRQLLTKPQSPTTTGKVERFHQTLQGECLDPLGPFPDLAAAQKAVDEFRDHYNQQRPHQALDDQVPASRFAPVPAEQRAPLGLDVPAELRDNGASSSIGDISANGANSADVAEEDLPGEPEAHGELTTGEHWLGGQALQFERTVTPTGNITVGRQQIWIGHQHIGGTVGVWVDTTTIHLALDGIGGRHYKTVPSRLNSLTLARLRKNGALPAGPPPVPVTAARGAPLGAVIEVDRTVNAGGCVGLGNRYVSIGQPLAGQRVTLRFDGHLAHILADGVLQRTIPAPVPEHLRGRLNGARRVTPDQPATPARQPGLLTVGRRVSKGGTTQVAGQTLRVGFAHRNTLVEVHVHDTEFRIHDQHGELLATIPKLTTDDVTRFKAYGWSNTT